MTGTEDPDVFIGGGGVDTMTGNGGDDTFFIGGNDFGTDVYDGGAGTDVIRLDNDISVSEFVLASNVTNIEALDYAAYQIGGTTGNDHFDISGISSLMTYRMLELFDGNDLFVGYRDSDYVNGGNGNDTLIGGDGADFLYGGAGDDSLQGDAGDDRFEISGTTIGRDVYNGGAGEDYIRLIDNVIVSQFLLTSATVIDTENLYFREYSITGTAGADLFNISGIATVIDYHQFNLLDGNDSFTGYQGNDLVDGGAGDDSLIGGMGNDVMTGGIGSDTFIGGAGDDTLTGGDGDDIFRIGGTAVGLDVMNGGAGNDAIWLDEDLFTSQLMLTTNNAISVNQLFAASFTIGGTGGDDVFNLIGVHSVVHSGPINLMDGNDRFIGHLAGDYVDGGAGDDGLVGWSGNDTLLGGTGGDALDGGAGDDSVDGGEGNDVLVGRGGDDLLMGGTGIDTVSYLAALSGVRVKMFVSDLQLISGDEGSDRLVSIERVIGSQYGDLIAGGALADRILGYGGNDVLAGVGGNDAIWGHAGNDTLSGGTGNDLLLGDLGNDLIWGEAGRDTLSGGAGADRFIFEAGSGSDLISDWEDGIDRILIRGTGYDALSDLTVRSGDGHIVISFGSSAITLLGVGIDQIDDSDFLFA